MATISFLESLGSKKNAMAWVKLHTAVGFEEYCRSQVPKEQVFQKAILDAIERWHKENRIGEYFIWKNGAGPYGNRNGLPDLMMVLGGKLYAFEVKRPWIGKATGIQLKTIEDLKKAGCRAAVVTFPSEVMTMLYEDGVFRE